MINDDDKFDAVASNEKFQHKERGREIGSERIKDSMVLVVSLRNHGRTRIIFLLNQRYHP